LSRHQRTESVGVVAPEQGLQTSKCSKESGGDGAAEFVTEIVTPWALVSSI
jgi:hypothetical protein